MPGEKPLPTDRQELGARGETLAEEWLAGRGYQVVARNYRCAYGEVDRIMREGDVLVFVEVKTRRSGDFGTPSEAVTAFKRRQISRTALHFLQHEAEDDPSCRFDVIEVMFTDGSPPQVRHLPAVFEAALEER
jgi:putative endonuclease